MVAQGEGVGSDTHLDLLGPEGELGFGFLFPIKNNPGSLSLSRVTWTSIIILRVEAFILSLNNMSDMDLR
jgi:hypothetical protein